MRKKHILFTIALLSLFTGIWSATGQAVNEVSPVATGFSLMDQYGKSYQIAYPNEKICVLVFADKWGSTQVEGWVRPLYETYQDAILIHGVAQLEGVPRWLRSTLVGIFKRMIKFSVMMDWTGEVSRDYEYPGGNAFVVIVDKQGNIRHRVKGKASKVFIDECNAIIDDLNPELRPLASK